MFVISAHWLLDDDSSVCKHKMDGYVLGNNAECVFFFALQGVSKGVVVEKLLLMMERDHGTLPEMVLCVGDDRSDEDMFESIESLMSEAPSAEVFACTVGQKPSKAKYYLDDVGEVIKMLQGLANASCRSSASSLPQLSEFSSLHI